MSDFKEITQTQINPLVNFMRQPKIYIKLPSNGLYWEEGSIEMPDNGEIPVYSMTAKDELTFKTPDALMNGQAIVDVIQSCLPNVKNAWKTPNIDLDAILIAIRIATYGEKMDITHKIPNTEEEAVFDIDLRFLLDQITQNTQWEEVIKLNEDLTCYVVPLTYKHVTATSLKTFETQRLMQAINDEKLSDEQKIEIFNKSFKTMVGINVDLVADSISAIQTPQGVVKDKKFIREFIENADNSIVQLVQEHIARMKTKAGVQPLIIHSTPEQIALGAPETYELPISMDNSDFFEIGS